MDLFCLCNSVSVVINSIEKQHFCSSHTGLRCIWATGLLLYTSGNKVEMEDFWAGALWALKIWLYLIISLIMIPAMFGFSLGISETYMTILVKILEVLLFLLLCSQQKYILYLCRYSHPLVHMAIMSPVCPVQWATLKIEKANADEGALKPSLSNGERKTECSGLIMFYRLV